MKKITKFLDSVMGGIKRTCIAKALAVFAVASIAINANAQTVNAQGVITGIGSEKGKSLADLRKAIVGNKDFTDPAKVFFFYNVKTGKFLSAGGYWDTHVALKDYGKQICIVGSTTTMRLAMDITTAQGNFLAFSGDYKDIGQNTKEGKDAGLFVDRGESEAKGWTFKLVDEATNTFKISTTGNYTNKYYTSHPDVYLCAAKDATVKGNNCEAYTEADLKKDAELAAGATWRVYSLADLIALQVKGIENMTAPLDLSFKLKSPGFPRGASDLKTGWTIKSYSTQTEDGEAGWYFGLHNVYTKVPNKWNVDETKVDKFSYASYTYLFDGTTYKQEEKNDELNSKPYEREMSKFYTASVKSVHGLIWQDVVVTQSGTYQIECKGFSTTDKAVIFAGVKDPNNNEQMLQNRISKNVLVQTSNMTEAEKMALGVTANTANGTSAHNVDYAGKEFYTTDKYTNSVQVKVEVPDGGTSTIRFGILIGQKNDTETPAADEWTVFDDFRLLFVSKTVNQDLVLDQDREDLKYLTETTNTYKNVSLHLNKKLIQNKWNSFVLPVDLTASQIRKAFGANTRLAKLSNLTGSAIEFASVDMDAVVDGKPAMEAYMPYIIFPSGSENDVTSPNYTAELDKADGTKEVVKIAANHYVIPSVTVPTKKDGDKEVCDWSKLNNDNWTTSMESTDGKMMALGTFARTFGEATQNEDGTWNIINKDKIIGRRDDLKGSYFFDNGKMYHSKDRARGLRGFSCWFKPTTNNSTSQNASFTLDGVSQGTTGIEDILADYEQPVSRFANGIYNLNGQLVKQGNSTAGLPSGLYIVNGKKCIVR